MRAMTSSSASSALSRPRRMWISASAFLQAEGRAPDDDLDLVLHPVADERVEGQRAGHAVDQGQHVGAEVGLQLGVLVEVVEHDLGHGVALEHDDQALAGAARGLVADVRDAGEATLLDQLGDLLREGVGVDLVGQLGDDQALPVVDLLHLDDRAHDDRTAAGAVGVLDALAAQDERAGREVRALDALHERLEQLLARRLRVLQVPLGARGDLPQVVRRDVGGHADGDARGAVDQQVGEPARQDGGLLRLAVVVVAEVDGVLVDVADHLHGQRRHPALGVPRGRGRVVARAAEVALAVDERVAHRPVLHQAHEGVVDGGVAVRVVLAHDLADDARALVVPAVGPVAAVVHRVDDAAVHRLEPVAHVGQRAADDDRHRVVDVAALHLGVEVDRLGAVGLEGRHSVSHAIPLSVNGFQRSGVCRARALRAGAVSRGTRPPGIRAPRCRGTARRARSAG